MPVAETGQVLSGKESTLDIVCRYRGEQRVVAGRLIQQHDINGEAGQLSALLGTDVDGCVQAFCAWLQSVDYRPNSMARGLVTGRSQTIGVVISGRWHVR